VEGLVTSRVGAVNSMSGGFDLAKGGARAPALG